MNNAKGPQILEPQDHLPQDCADLLLRHPVPYLPQNRQVTPVAQLLNQIDVRLGPAHLVQANTVVASDLGVEASLFLDVFEFVCRQLIQSEHFAGKRPSVLLPRFTHELRLIDFAIHARAQQVVLVDKVIEDLFYSL